MRRSSLCLFSTSWVYSLSMYTPCGNQLFLSNNMSAWVFFLKAIEIGLLLLALYFPNLLELLIGMLLAMSNLALLSSASTVDAIAWYIHSFLLELSSHSSSPRLCMIIFPSNIVLSNCSSLLFSWSFSFFRHFLVHFVCLLAGLFLVPDLLVISWYPATGLFLLQVDILVLALLFSCIVCFLVVTLHLLHFQ